jgi:hypothetical protein
MAGDEVAAGVERSLLMTARSGVDSFISREESLRALSTRVYRNAALHSGVIDREIAKGLLRGLSADEMAAIIRNYIRPGVPGGSSYAAMRLARTEINNAFHQTTIRYTREMPWVEGYRWNLSGSHPRTDICNSYAQDSHGAGGRGFYDKRNVPSKPHPQCLCYITPETMDNKDFYKRLRSGAFDPYINQITRQGTFETDTYTSTRFSSIADSAVKAATVFAISAAARRFLT